MESLNEPIHLIEPWQHHMAAIGVFLGKYQCSGSFSMGLKELLPHISIYFSSKALEFISQSRNAKSILLRNSKHSKWMASNF